MLVKEDKDAPGGLTFDESHIYNPIEGKQISFFLKKIQLFEQFYEQKKQNQLYDNQMGNKKERSPYKLLVLIEGQPKKTLAGMSTISQFYIEVQAVAGINRPYHNIWMTQSERQQIFKKNYPIWNELVKIRSSDTKISSKASIY